MQPWWQLILPTMHLNLRCGWNDGKSICYVYFVLFFVPNSELLGKNSTIIQWLNGYLLQGQDRKITFFCIRYSWWPTQVVQTVAHEHRVTSPQLGPPAYKQGVTSPLLGPQKWCNHCHMKGEWHAPIWAHTSSAWRESDEAPGWAHVSGAGSEYIQVMHMWMSLGYAGCRHWSCKRRCSSSLQFCSDKTQNSSAIRFKPFQVCSIYIHLASHWSFPHFIESRISFPRSQKSDSCPFPMSPVKSCFFNIHFYIILLSMSSS